MHLEAGNHADEMQPVLGCVIRMLGSLLTLVEVHHLRPNAPPWSAPHPAAQSLSDELVAKAHPLPDT